MFFVFGKIYAERFLFFKILVASLFVNILALATPIYVIQVLQRYVAYGVISTLITLFVGIIFIVVFELLFKNIRHRMARQYELENIVFTNRVLNKFVNIKTHVYAVSKKFRNDIINYHLTNIQNTFTATNILSIVDIPFTIIFLIALFLIHYQLGLITLFFIGLPFLLNRFLNDRVRGYSKKSIMDNNNSYRLFENVLTRNSTIKYFSILNFITNTWNLIANSIAVNRENLESEKNLITSIAALISSLLTIFIIGWGAILAVNGEISVGALIGANILAARALMPINRFIAIQENLSKMENSFSELGQFNNFASERNQGREIQDLKGEIILENISFSYPNNKNAVFENLDISITPGQMAVITGNNGSGKSTLINALAGVIDFSKGRMFIDNIEITQLSEAWFRKMIVYSPQEPKFVDGTIKDNIIGESKISQSDLSRILKEVDLINFINSDTSGIRKILDSSGEELPLGIRKRMSFARAMINNGKLVYLDEPTDGLDKVGKNAVINMIKRFKAENKTIVIASNNQDIINMSDYLVDLNSKPKPIIVRQKNGKKT